MLASILVVGFAIGLSINKEELEKITQTEPSSSQSQNESAYQSLDELVKDSMVIVSGTMKDSSSFDTSTIEYVFEVERQFKGEGINETIHIYEGYSDARYTVGEKYVLFLERWEGGLYPAPVHTSIDETQPIKIKGTTIHHDYVFLDKNLHTGELFEAIENSPSIHEPSSYEDLNNSSHMLLNNSISTLEELIEESDWIGRVIPTHIHQENKYFKNIGLKEIESFKETESQSIEEVTTIYVPTSVELNNEYILFLKNHNGTYQVTTRENSVVSKEETEHWEKILSVIDK